MTKALGVIFDMDGVLVDTYWTHFQSWQQMANERGLVMTKRQFDATFGRTSREIIASLWPNERMTEAEIAALDWRKEAVFRELLAADFPAMPGAKELLHQLYQAGIPAAIGSSGPSENVDLIVDLLGARPLVASQVTATDVKRGKPDPDVFLLAAQRLGVPPQRCCVVEDAPLGIEAAHRAGMAGVGLASTGRTRHMLRAADLVADALSEFSPRVFRRIFDGRR